LAVELLAIAVKPIIAPQAIGLARRVRADGVYPNVLGAWIAIVGTGHALGIVTAIDGFIATRGARRRATGATSVIAHLLPVTIEEVIALEVCGTDGRTAIAPIPVEGGAKQN
jgi:hypothetical protein